MKQLAKEWRMRHQAPADMEARLVAQFRQANPARSSGHWRWWAVAAAVILVLFSLRPKQEQPPAEVRSSVAPPVYRAATVREQPAQLTPPLPVKRYRSPRTATPKPQEVVEVYTDFFPLEEGSGPIEIERGRVVRVSMPRSSLIRVGLPVNMDRLNDAIQADLVLSEEGIAKAVRFVQ